MRDIKDNVENIKQSLTSMTTKQTTKFKEYTGTHVKRYDRESRDYVMNPTTNMNHIDNIAFYSAADANYKTYHNKPMEQSDSLMLENYQSHRPHKDK